MLTWIALLRGVNVGGRNKLPMQELVEIMEALGLENVRTYIQSGNAVFQTREPISPALGDELASAIERRHGFRPRVLLLSLDQLEHAMMSNPFPEGEAEPKTLHLFFLASPATDPDLGSLTGVQKPSERFHLTDEVFYLHAPDGIGRSKLVQKVERCLRVPATARNWQTVQKLSDLARSL